MGTFTKAITVAELTAGMKKTVVIGGKKLAIANVDGEFFAIDDTCSHEECSLGTEGFLEGKLIICGCHGSQFDITDGKVLSLPAPTDVASYETKVENGDVLVNI
jgi:3-phenylpropionate/trans-cinnamate dioxygenase ferredoxin component